MLIKKSLFLLLAAGLVFSACTWDNEEDLDAMGQDPDEEEPINCADITLSGDITQIIQNNCAIPACHGGSRSPLMTTPELIIAAAERIKVRTQAGTMPPNNPLPADRVETIACWVDAGAPNN